METQLHKYYEDEDILVRVEFVSPSENLLGYANLHIEVYKWTPSVAKKCYRVFAQLESNCKENKLKMITFSPNPKFAELFGGRRTGASIDEYEVVVWD